MNNKQLKKEEKLILLFSSARIIAEMTMVVGIIITIVYFLIKT